MSSATPSTGSTPRVAATAPSSAEARLHEVEPTVGRGLKRFASPNGRGVSVERNHAGPTVEKSARVASCSERAIDVKAAFARRERLKCLVQQDRNMAEPAGRGGAHHEAPGGACASRSARNRLTRSRACSRWV